MKIYTRIPTTTFAVLTAAMKTISSVPLPQGKRIIKGSLGNMGKIVYRRAFSENPRKQGFFETRSYNHLIVITNIVLSDMPMSLKNTWKTRGF